MPKILNKKENWPRLLHEFIANRRNEPFAIGSNDCCLFVCDAIEVITGVDIAVDFRGTYATEKEMLQVIKDNGGVSGIADRVFEDHGIQPIEIPFAGRGDIALLESDGRDALGIISTCGRVIASAGTGGLVFNPKSHAKKAWRVS